MIGEPSHVTTRSAPLGSCKVLGTPSEGVGPSLAARRILSTGSPSGATLGIGLPPMLSPEETAALKGSLLLWARGAEMSYERIVADRDNKVGNEVDARFLALAVRNVLRAARLACNHTDGASMTAIQAPIDDFDAAVPNAIDVRDIIEHFDDYVRGKGNRQKNGTMLNPLEYSVRFENEYLLGLADTHRLDARSGSEAAIQLAEAVLDII